MRQVLALLALVLFLDLPAQAHASEASEQNRATPEPGGPVSAKKAQRGTDFMVVAAHPLAAQAGYTILSQGGSAVDAAIATQLVLNLVEPQSSGIGGGGFMLHYDAEAADLVAYDGRETAPAAATKDLFLKPDGTPMGFGEAITGGRSVGIPGLLAMLHLAHQQHGTLPWADLFGPAIEIAERGAPVGERLSSMLTRWKRYFFPYRDTRRTFYDDDGKALQPGDRLTFPGMANTLKMIAEQGPAAFYEGPLTGPMVDRIKDLVANSDYPDYAGPSRGDFANYRPVVRDAVCAAFKSYNVCGMPPPSSGGVAVGQILGIVEALPQPENPRTSAQAIHGFIEAQRRAFADRNLYLGDPDFVDPPVLGLIDRGYLDRRAATIDAEAVAEQISDAGTPPGGDRNRFAPDREPKNPGTTHVSIIDADGNVVSMTTSIETAFGSRAMANGYLLNNQLTDFAFVPERQGKPVANAPAAGKRPLSSMSPTIVFDRVGRPVMITGSPGGTSIISYTARSILAHLGWGLGLQQALDYPHIVNTNEAETVIEREWPLIELRGELEAMGHTLKLRDRLTSGLHAITIDHETGTITGAADKRREGAALGE